MAGAAPDRAAVEAHWRERLRDAKLRLDFARQYMKEVEQDRTEGAVPATDGEFAFQKALRAENHALAEYRRILRVFADLVVEGKMPDERQAAGG